MEGACSALKRIGKDAVEPLLHALGSRKPYVKIYYIATLFEIGDERVIEPIIKTLENILTSDRPGFRTGALYAFRSEILEKKRIEVSRAIDILLRILDSKWVLPLERKEIAEILAEIGDERALEPLARNWKSSAIAYKDTVEQCFRSLARKLGNSAIEYIMPALKDDKEHVRKMAIMTLAEIGDERVIEPITQLLNDKKRIVRNAAKMALEQIESRKNKA
jgi:HEAT repeat protein